MTIERLQQITGAYARLNIAVAGDLCLDRYFEIDPALQETSIETGLPVHNVTRLRCQPGASGTIINNLAALGVGDIYPIGIIGADGEGYELKRALEKIPAVKMDGLIESQERLTFTYSKPLLMHSSRAPEELNRLDIKNWSPTPLQLQQKVSAAIDEISARVDAVIVLDQVDQPETGVVTKAVLKRLENLTALRPDLLVLADSRRGLKDFPPLSFKMNAAELAASINEPGRPNLEAVRQNALSLSGKTGRHVFITMSEHGIIGAHKAVVEHAASLPLRGEIDIVGAGDSVTANLVTALAAGATLRESLQLSQLAASIVVHQLGTTGTAGVKEMTELLLNSPFYEKPI